MSNLRIGELSKELMNLNSIVYGVTKDRRNLENQLHEGQQTLNRIETSLEKSSEILDRLRYVQGAVKRIYRKQFSDRDVLGVVQNNLLKLQWLRQPFPRITDFLSFVKRAIAFSIREPNKAVNYALFLVKSSFLKLGKSSQTYLTNVEVFEESESHIVNNAQALREYAKKIGDIL